MALSQEIIDTNIISDDKRSVNDFLGDRYDHMFEQIADIKEEKLWRDIRTLAKSNPILDRSLKNIISMYDRLK